MKINKKTSGTSFHFEHSNKERIPDNFPCLQRRDFLKKMSILSGSAFLGQLALASENKGQEGLATELLSTVFGNKEKANEVFKSLDFRQVKVGGEIGRRINNTIYNNLLVLNVDKDFLLPFQQKECDGKNYGGYIGLGKLIDAAVRFAAYTSNEKVMALKKHIVDEIIKTQEPDGYIGIMVKEARMWQLWDIHEMGYIIMGLAVDYHFFQEKRSLVAAQKLADYIIDRWSTMPDSWVEWGAVGLDSNLLILYRETNNKKYLDFLIQQRELTHWAIATTKELNPILKGHIYTDLDQCFAQFELSHIQPEEQLLQQSRRAIDFMTHGDGMTITGTTGLWEEWSNVQEGRGTVGETCATAAQIHIFNALLRVEGNSLYGDILERMIYNALFAVQSPDGRKLNYFTPLEGERVYFSKDTFCCPNNFRRIISHLPSLVYYLSATGVIVNLYTPSETTITLNNKTSLKIRQDTEYPSDGKVVILLDPSKLARFILQLRIPKWCDKAAVSVNGEPVKDPIISGEFLKLDREWHAGDQVILDMPMPFRMVLGRKRQAGRAAVMRGPVVFCFDHARNDKLMKKDAADLTSYMIDPASLKLIPDDSIRPNGVACTVDANERTFSLGTIEFNFKLTEFPDHDGKVTYFRIPDFSVAVEDEILSGQ